MTCELRKPEKPKQSITAAAPGAGLSEEEKDYLREIAFFEQNTNEGVIEDLAEYLGEHPLVTGGGTLALGAGGPSSGQFIKGDVEAIFRDQVGKQWDGSPRFGMGPYVQNVRGARDWRLVLAGRGAAQKKEAAIWKAMTHMG